MHKSCGEASSPRQVKVQTPPHPSYGGGHQAKGAPGRTVSQDHQVCVCSQAQVRHLGRQDHGHCELWCQEEDHTTLLPGAQEDSEPDLRESVAQQHGSSGVDGQSNNLSSCKRVVLLLNWRDSHSPCMTVCGPVCGHL
uniref:Uncharacterized protein n=1 Tax=Timema douglasi TaxID=61478 RepID=A0A7R8ZED4_TIMDO|nr:unnamed protein product [Timema douglasi]